MTPTLGRIVLYTLNDSDVQQIDRRRTTGAAIAERIAYDSGDPMMKAWPAGAQAHMGNSVTPGQQVPAIITAVWPTSVNLRCILDGTDEFWATSRLCYTPEGDHPTAAPMGMWQWPLRS